MLEDDAACVPGSRAHEGFLKTGHFCGDADLASWHASRVVDRSETAKDATDDVRNWLACRVQMWAVLVVGLREEEAEKILLNGDEFVDLSADDLAHELKASGLADANVEALVAARSAGTWWTTAEVGFGFLFFSFVILQILQIIMCYTILLFLVYIFHCVGGWQVERTAGSVLGSGRFGHGS